MTRVTIIIIAVAAQHGRGGAVVAREQQLRAHDQRRAAGHPKPKRPAVPVGIRESEAPV